MDRFGLGLDKIMLGLIFEGFWHTIISLNI